MKTKVFLLILMFSSLTFYAQNGEFSTYDLKKVMSITQFKGAKTLRGLSSQKLDELFNKIEGNSNLLKQININSWAVCDYKKIDNFNTYNYYYSKIQRSTFDMYCKELNALMLLDGTITQMK